MSKLYVSDLDGTLLANDGLISDFALRELQRLIDGGLEFTVASARSVISMRECLRGLRLNLPVINFDGAYISDLLSGRHRVIEAHDREVVEAIYELMTGRGRHPFVSFHDGERDRSFYKEVWNDGMEWYIENRRQARDSRLERHDDPAAAFEHRVVCMTLIGRHEHLCDISEQIGREYAGRARQQFYENQYQPDWWWLTLHPPQATKASAVERLIKDTGHTPEKVVVFGDHDNDVTMFELAGRAVAVENATEKLKRHADEVIGTNEKDSVVDYLRREAGWVAAPKNAA